MICSFFFTDPKTNAKKLVDLGRSAASLGDHLQCSGCACGTGAGGSASLARCDVKGTAWFELVVFVGTTWHQLEKNILGSFLLRCVKWDDEDLEVDRCKTHIKCNAYGFRSLFHGLGPEFLTTGRSMPCMSATRPTPGSCRIPASNGKVLSRLAKQPKFWSGKNNILCIDMYRSNILVCSIIPENRNTKKEAGATEDVKTIKHHHCVTNDQTFSCSPLRQVLREQDFKHHSSLRAGVCLGWIDGRPFLRSELWNGIRSSEKKMKLSLSKVLQFLLLGRTFLWQNFSGISLLDKNMPEKRKTRWQVGKQST